MRMPFFILSAFLLAACVGNPPRQQEIVRHDLGDLSGAWSSPGFPVAAVAVRAAPWLETADQAYRLAYAEPLRRRAYAESRWAALPAELIERFLNRRIVFGQSDFAGAGCRLELTLDELEQRFDSPTASAVVLEARAILHPPRGKVLVSKRAFAIRHPAPTPDARGGAEATRAAAAALADEIGVWLGSLARERPRVADICAGGAG